MLTCGLFITCILVLLSNIERFSIECRNAIALVLDLLPFLIGSIK